MAAQAPRRAAARRRRWRACWRMQALRCTSWSRSRTCCLEGTRAAPCLHRPHTRVGHTCGSRVCVHVLDTRVGHKKCAGCVPSTAARHRGCWASLGGALEQVVPFFPRMLPVWGGVAFWSDSAIELELAVH
eukprot:52228-Chlamydomonas_euryale.AAC.1